MRNLLPIVILSFFFVQCNEGEEKPDFNQGVITYDVTFPFNQDDILIHVFPTEMTMEFKEDKMHGKLKTLGSVVQTDFIVDNKAREFNQLLKAFEDRYVLSLDSRGVDEMLKTVPRMKLIPTEETDSLAGYLCKKTIATFTNDSVPAIELWHTDEIDIKTPNWCNQFFELDEVLLGYEVEEYGMRMRLRAREVKYEEISDKQFEIPANHSAVDLANMRSKIIELLETFMQN
jgi:hypothetical protein